MTVSELHSHGRRVIPAVQLHRRLHDMAVDRFAVGSLSQLSPDQCDQLAAFLRTLPPLQDGPRGTRRTTGVYYSYSRRHRPGNTSGTLRPVSPRQLECICKMANQVFHGVRSHFERFLQRECGFDSMAEVLTTKDGCKVFQALSWRIKRSTHPQPASRGTARGRPPRRVDSDAATAVGRAQPAIPARVDTSATRPTARDFFANPQPIPARSASECRAGSARQPEETLLF